MKKLLEKAIPKLYGFYFNTMSVFSKKRSARLALTVFSKPRRGRLLPSHKKFLSTAVEQKLACEDGLASLYLWKGTGKTVFLAHGWESNSARWQYLIEPLLEKNYQVIALDAPAHGGSDGKLFTAIKYSKTIRMALEVYEPEIIIAHSVGAMATIYQESKYKHKSLEKLIILGSPNSLEVIMKGYQQLVGFNKNVYQYLNDLLKETFEYTIEEFNTADFAAQISVPTIIIHNKTDRMVPYPAATAIHEKMPNSILYSSKTGAHSLHTPEVVDQVMDFLSKE